jgi:hypothetical protein
MPPAQLQQSGELLNFSQEVLPFTPIHLTPSCHTSTWRPPSKLPSRMGTRLSRIPESADNAGWLQFAIVSSPRLVDFESQVWRSCARSQQVPRSSCKCFLISTSGGSGQARGSMRKNHEFIPRHRCLKEKGRGAEYQWLRRGWRGLSWDDKDKPKPETRRRLLST